MGRGPERALKLVLAVGGILSLIYGVAFLVVPGLPVWLGGASVGDVSWLRWPGGWLIAFAIANLQVIRAPAGQKPYITMHAIATLLAGVALLFSWLAGEYSGPPVYIAIQTFVAFGLSALLWWVRRYARRIL
jgi:hypothetical protein